MAQTSYPFDEQSVTEDQWSAMMSTAQESRVVTGLAVYGDSSGRQVKAPLGTAWVRGHFYVSTAEETLAIGANASGNPRIDTVVLTLDPTANSIVLAVVAGTAAAAPVPPTLTQTDTGVYQYPLADVAVANGAATIAATDVTPRVRVATATVGRNMPGSNLLQNGSFKVAQRGTSFTSATTPANSDDTYLLDRWVLLSDGNDVVDVTQSSDAPTGHTKSIALDVETGNKKFGILQVVEATNVEHALDGAVTLSFYAKMTGTSIGNVKATVLAWSSTADTVTSDVVSAWGASGTTPTWAANWTAENVPTNLNVTTAWARYTVTATLDTASTTNVAVFIWCDDAATTAGDFLYLSAAQLEVGSVATGFEHKSYGTELAECQRYYQHMEYAAENQFYPFVGDAYDATTLTAIYLPPMNFRVAPAAVSFSNVALIDSYGASTVAITGASILQASRYAPLVAFTVASGLTANTSYWVKTASASQSYIGISADL